MLLNLASQCQAQVELRVLPARTVDDRSPSALYQRLHQWANEAIERRRDDYEKLKSAEDIAAWQRTRREIFLRALGPMPAPTPLDARTVGKLDGDGFRVEKVIFASRPRHHITATLYLPTTPPPYPGVIVPCGHSFTGKGAEAYQRVSMLLARNGIAALCYDPIGQGERYQTFDAQGQPLGADYQGGASSVRQLADVAGHPHFNPVEEHTLMGIGAILVGTNTAQYRIHDGMRAIDYLTSRPEIDATRIGCTGNSGGGTLTAYLMALDERVACAAPTCYLTTFDRLLATSGPQDAEQNLFGQLRDGLDEADYVLMRAPKPTVLCAGTRDATFDITGTWDIYREAKRVYARQGFAERVDLVEADEPHGFTQPLRVGATRWMRRWLLGVDDAITEPELTTFSLTELQCTPDGQVMKLPNEKSVFQLNAERAAEMAAVRAELWDGPRDAALERVRELAGIRRASDIGRPNVRKHGEIRRGELRIERLLMETDTGLTLPALRFIPNGSATRRVLYVHSDGKAADAMPGGPIEMLTQAGAIVLAVDLSGLGENAVRHPRHWGGQLFPWNPQEFFLAYLLGKSLVGIRAEEILASTHIASDVANSDTAQPIPVELIAVGSAAGIPATHAAALESNRFSKVALHESLDSWLTVIDDPTAGPQLTNTVHAALTAYDLLDLLMIMPN
ncbi:MAG: acetylxylan esterase [Planctomycetales bacterium]|nr:acetylxylan esterase [Planctomycetales bacterium]